MKYRSIKQLSDTYLIPYQSVFNQVKKGIYHNTKKYEKKTVVSEKEFVLHNYGNKKLNKQAQEKLKEAFSSFQR